MTRRSFVASLAATAAPKRQFWITLDLQHNSKSIHWPNAENPVNTGSLLKPFLVLAYGALHPHFPTTHCSGTKDGCWLPRGHGNQNIVNALANSCNAYFLSLAGNLDRAALESACLSYGLTPPDRASTPAALIGLGHGWPQSPLAIVDAFARLAQNRTLATVEIVLAGMQRCASVGTARSIGLACYAKTGTAPCSHTPRADGDGFVLAIYPPLQPRAVTLLEEHGTTGAETARALRQKID